MSKLYVVLGCVGALALVSGCCCGGGGSSDDVAGPCGAYSTCCAAYADALSGMAGYTEDTIQAIKDGCAMTEQLAGTPGGDDACQAAFDGLKQGMDAMGAMPGWETPATCK
jgi:hypothetical protein